MRIKIPVGTPTWLIDVDVWWRGNQIIQQVPLILFNEDAEGKRNRSVVIKHYSFLDPNQNVCYNYKTFSDTAKVIKYYQNIDSVVIDGGQNFLSNERLEYDKIVTLKDTLINNVKLGRLKAQRNQDDAFIQFIMYYEFDKRFKAIELHRQLSDSIGFPITRNDTYVNSKLFMSTQIGNFYNKLSEGEIKVFDEWNKNAKSNPVK